ncbi:alanyl-tRNA editing protein [Enterobacter bugandensis]|uniref:alanyl-tRNA editing protein n=1 Tax=Enterobacter bugandensis TaxID=881260 RepID=UPI001299C51A|nr:alanyl-tRNA editing protein [Enterobacter bugandensis]MRE94203.1 alanyl-tRNA editing protein [Enterobacter bugandensis]
MTERLYYTSEATEGRAKVICCTEEADGRYAVELDKTLFHPQGGGQPADRGWIAGIAVEGVSLRGEQVIHMLARPLAPGEVEMQVDQSARIRHSRWHSAGHLIGYAGEQFGWEPVKAHHWPGEGRITFTAGELLASIPDASAMMVIINGWKTDNLLRHTEIEAGRRKVRFGDLPAYACGGTHVKELAEIGGMQILGLKMKKGQLVIAYALDELEQRECD